MGINAIALAKNLPKAAKLVHTYIGEIEKYLPALTGLSWSEIIKEIEKLLKGPKGSMVTLGIYEGASIMSLGSVSCIVFSKKEILPLNEKTVKKCEYAEKKFKKPQKKDYYYYGITFKDDQMIRVRVSEKQKKNLDRLCRKDITETTAESAVITIEDFIEMNDDEMIN